MIIGITGTIGSGKTTVAKIFSNYGFKVINADKIGHSILKSNRKIKHKIIKEFGHSVLDNKKNIDRKKLGNIVFNNQNEFKKLNSIMHPVIISNIKKTIKAYQQKNKNIVVDAPLLLETELNDFVDIIIVVKCDEKIIFERLLKNRQLSKEKIKTIIKNQMPHHEKIKYADFVIDNSGVLENTKKQEEFIINRIGVQK